MSSAAEGRTPGLSVTALYTSATWAWGKLPGAELLDHPDAQRVFGVTNLVLGAVRAVRRGAPSLPHSLIQRHLMIDALLAESEHLRVLELAAGLSRRCVTLSSDARIICTEIDRSPVIARKRALLERSAEGRAVLARPNLRFIAADLGDFQLGTLPADAVGSAAERLFVIAEGLLMYLRAPEQRRLWSDVHALLAVRGGTFVFDLVPALEQPPPGVIGRGLAWAMKRATSGVKFETDQRDRATIARELEQLGFRVEVVEPRTAPARWKLPHHDVHTQQLVFVCRV